MQAACRSAAAKRPLRSVQAPDRIPDADFDTACLGREFDAKRTAQLA
jgi:hypothetical protein